MDKFYTRKEAAGLLGISLTALDAARTGGLITYVQYVDNECVYLTNAVIQEVHFHMYAPCQTKGRQSNF